VTSAGAITQSGALTVAGTSQITATGQSITLSHADNEFGGVVTVSGAQTTLTDKNALSVVLDATGDVALTAKGTLEASGKVAGEGSDLTLTASDGGATALAATTVGGQLTVTSAGAITQSGAVTVAGVTNISAGAGSVTLTQTNNDFKGTVSITSTGAVSLRDKDDLTVSLSGASEVSAVTGARLGLSATGALKLAALQVGGDLALDAAGDIGIQQVRSDRGAIRITSGGAIYDSTSGESQSGINISTPGSLTLSAQSGIGAFGKASLRVSAGTVEASNALSGDVVIAGMQGLRGGANGFVNKAPDGWLALLTDQGRLEPGRLEVTGGRSVMMTGKTSITKKDAEGFLATIAVERAPITMPASRVAEMGASQLSTSSSGVLSAGLAAVTQGLLGGDGMIPISQLMSRGSSAPMSVSGKLIDAVSSAASTEKAVSSVLVSVSQTPTASQAMQADTGVLSASTSRAAPAVPAAGGSPAPMEVPAQAPEAPARDQGAPNTQPGGASSAPESTPAPADAPSPERGSQGADQRSEAYEPEPVLGLRSRLSVALQGLTGRLLRLIERADPVNDQRSTRLSMTAEPSDQPTRETSALQPDLNKPVGSPTVESGTGDGKA
jgi:hypothetical protein